MSIGPVGFFSSVASTQLAQGGAEAERAQHEGAAHARGVDANAKAEKAAGVGRTEEEHEAADRDADGRRPWEQAAGAEPATTTTPPNDSLLVEPPHSKDPTGESGRTLDLSG